MPALNTDGFKLNIQTYVVFPPALQSTVEDIPINNTKITELMCSRKTCKTYNVIDSYVLGQLIYITRMLVHYGILLTTNI